jgi:hypothetical protein
MALPNITFNIAQTGLNRLGDGIQKIPGLVITGNTIAEGISLGESHQIFSLAAAEALGITEEGTNAFAWKHLNDFYTEAGQGAELWLMLVSDATTYDQMADLNEDFAKKLIDDASGNIRVLGLVKKSPGTETIADGLDEDSHAGVIKLQALAEHYAGKFRPFRAVISGNKFNGTVADLLDYETTTHNRVNMLIANNDGSPEAAIGLSLGRLARIPTQRKQYRVRDGMVIPLLAYFTNGAPVESLIDSWDAIDDKNYTYFRNFAGRAGYYFSGDRTLTANENDFSSLARGLVMDEAVLIAYDVLVNELGGEVPLNEAGQIHPAIIKNWQANIETQLKGQMTDLGKLSGAKAFIDANQDVLQTDTVEVRIDLLPVGYSDYIKVNIGFTTEIE